MEALFPSNWKTGSFKRAQKKCRPSIEALDKGPRHHVITTSSSKFIFRFGNWRRRSSISAGNNYLRYTDSKVEIQPRHQRTF
jgi:hypothetical protein